MIPENSVTFPHNKPSPTIVKQLEELCDKIESLGGEDTGYKGGCMTTSYEYTYKDFVYHAWWGDAEHRKTIVDVGSVYHGSYGGSFYRINKEELYRARQLFNL